MKEKQKEKPNQRSRTDGRSYNELSAVAGKCGEVKVQQLDNCTAVFRSKDKLSKHCRFSV